MKLQNMICLLMLAQSLFAFGRDDNMLIIGHRGACGYAPENTLSSFQKALDMGVDMIELDVFVCLTDELVVIHDEDVDRTTNGHGKVVDMNFQQLRRLIVDGDEQIPTLDEVIQLVNRQVPINIELKGPGTAVPVTKLINSYLQQGWKSTDFFVSSFDHAQVLEFKQLCPSVTTGVLFWNSWKNFLCEYFSGFMPDKVLQFLCGNDERKMVQIALQHKADFIGLDVASVTKQMVDCSHRSGFPVWVYTVNDKETADRLRAMHVDGICSNYPDLV